MAAELNAFVGDLQFARSEAIKRGQFVTMCASSTGGACLGANTTNWSPGWIVFTDTNNNDAVDGSESVIRIQAALQGGDRLVSNSSGAVTFNRNGFSGNAQTLVLNNSTNPIVHPPCVVLSSVGRVRTANIKDATQPLDASNCK